MTQQLSSHICPVAVLSMKGKLTGSTYKADGKAELSYPEEDILEGQYPILLAHPESLVSDPGQKLLRKLKSQRMFRGLVMDEFHQVQ